MCLIEIVIYVYRYMNRKIHSRGATYTGHDMHAR